MTKNEEKVYRLTQKEIAQIQESHFAEQIKLFIDGKDRLTVNGKLFGQANYNLLVSIRDVSLWTKGMKPTRSWQISHVKNYFNLTGNKYKVLANLQELKDILLKTEQNG